MTHCRSRGEAATASVQNVQAPTCVLPRDAGEDEGGGLNDLNLLNALNAYRGTGLLPRFEKLASRTITVTTSD